MILRNALPIALILAAASTPATAALRQKASVAAATEAARVNPRLSGWQGATQLFAFEPGRLYQVEAAVGRVTDIMLQEGERMSETGAVAAGDTVRWVIGEAASGTGVTRRTHILVKPTDPNLRTNLVINTDRRTYHIELRSGLSSYLASAAWSYPQDELIALEARAQILERQSATEVQVGIDLARLNFSYSLKGDAPSWRPRQVFDDGAKTYILFPENIRQGELPPLFLIGERKEATLVNYRVAGHFMIVDRLFDAAELRLGTRRQRVVRIERMIRREQGR